MELKDIKQLIQIVDAANIAELEIEHDDFKIKIKKSAGGISLPAAEVQPPAVEAVPQPRPEPTAITQAKVPANMLDITSPMVGTFYRAPAPDAEPYVKVGDMIEPGQVLFIIEAMKMMNEIESEHRGRVVEFLVENGESVEYGQPLIRLELMD